MQEGIAAAFAVAALVCAATALAAWRHRRNTPAAAALAVAMAGIGVWAGADVLLHVGADAGLQRIAGMTSYVGIYATTAGLWCLSRAVADRRWRLHPRTARALAAGPALFMTAIVTDPLHHLVFSSVTVSGPDSLLRVTLGPLFWVHAAYCYALLGWGLLRLVGAWRRAEGVFRRQLTHLLAAAAIPLVGNVAVVVLQRGAAAVDYTPLFFALTGLIDARALLRHRLLQLVPVAREQVMTSIDDAVVVLDAAGRVIDVNPAARELLSRHRPGAGGDLVGRPAADVLPPRLAECLDDGPPHRQVELLPGLHLDARTTALTDRRGRPLGRVVVTRDISELVEQRRAAQEATARLAEQLALTRTLQARLAEEAARDSLTGLHNRRHLVEALEAALARAVEEDGPVSVVLLDVDHFKAVNDTHGHRGGDAALQAVARVLLQGCRSGDTVARYGGEEFVVLLPGTGRAEALERAEDLRRRCAALAVPVPGPATAGRARAVPSPAAAPHRDGTAASIRVTFSAGVATSPEDAADADSLLAVADRALYAAKAAGRDRVVAAG